MTKTAKIGSSKTTEALNKRKSSSRLNGFRKSSSGILFEKTFFEYNLKQVKLNKEL